MIKHKGASYPVIFPAYSIGDGKVYVEDVLNRIALIMKLGDRRKRRIKMFYKGRQLKIQDKPIRDYGVKNNSELMLQMPEGKLSDEDEDGAISGSDSGEEVVVAEAREESKPRKYKKNNNSSKGGKKKKRKDQGNQRENAYVPDREKEGSNGGKTPSDEKSRHPSRIPSPTVLPAGPIEKLNAISEHFETQMLPLCRDYIAKPPTDPKRREDEHRKLGELVMQHVLLKLDEVDTGGDPDIRARRKELVNRVQGILKHLDDTKKSRS